MTHRDFEETNMIGRGPREQCRSVPRGSVKKELSLADRESCVTLYRGVAFKEVTLCRRIAFFLKKRGSVTVEDRENRVAPKERYVSLPRFSVNKA